MRIRDARRILRNVCKEGLAITNRQEFYDWESEYYYIDHLILSSYIKKAIIDKKHQKIALSSFEALLSYAFHISGWKGEFNLPWVKGRITTILNRIPQS